MTRVYSQELTHGQPLVFRQKNEQMYHFHLFPKPRYHLRYELKHKEQKVKTLNYRYQKCI
jgi:hypothetical protein